MKILMLTPYFPPYMQAEAIVNGKLAKALVEKGIDLTVVTMPNHNVKIRPDESPSWKKRMGEVVCIDPPWYVDVKPKRIARTASKIRSLEPSATWFANKAYAFCRKLVMERNYDILLTRSPSLDTVIIGARLKREFVVKWVAGFNDPCPDYLYPPPYNVGGPSTLLEHYEINWLRKNLAMVDHVLFPCRRLGKYFQEMLEIDLSERTVIVPHIGWGRTDDKAPGGPVEILQAGNVKKERISFNFFDWFVETFNRYPELRGRLKLVLLGRIHRYLKRYLKEKSIDDIIVVEDQVYYEKSLYRLSRSDLLFIMEAPFPEGIFLPSKFCDYVAADKPLLLFSPEKGTIADYVGGFDHPGFMGQSEAGVKTCLDRLFKRIRDGRGWDDYVFPRREEFSAERVTSQFLEAIGGLTGGEQG